LRLKEYVETERLIMGTFHYDGSKFELDDRLLAHLQVIIAMKLRRSEGFFLSWEIASVDGSGRHVIWIDNGVPIRMRYAGSRQPQINREWAESLAQAANTNNGLVVTDEKIQAADPVA
jgi:hypothetical protein